MKSATKPLIGTFATQVWHKGKCVDSIVHHAAHVDDIRAGFCEPYSKLYTSAGQLAPYFVTRELQEAE